MKLQGVSCIYDPGCHCAFTDIIKWRGRIYVTFREAVNHSVHHSGQIVVLGSADYGQSFQPHARLGNSCDLRDPHFFTVGERLGIMIPSWIVPDPEKGIPERIRNCHVALSDDGINWDLKEIEALRGRTLWRPRRGPDGALYSAAYAPSRVKDDYRVSLRRSTDGENWEDVSLIHGEDKANETDLCFMPDGELLALVRREQEPRKPLIARSKPPYKEWTKVGCDRFLQGPLLERLPDGTLLIVGRSPEPFGADKPTGGCRTRGFRLNIETGELEFLFTLPSGGDTSYAGLLKLNDNEAFLSYYSGHMYPNGSYRDGDAMQRCGIYLAKFAL